MLEYNNLIGLDPQDAIKVLNKQGITNVNLVINSKPNERAKTLLVCAVKNNEDSIDLICGEFCLDI